MSYQEVLGKVFSQIAESDLVELSILYFRHGISVRATTLPGEASA